MSLFKASLVLSLAVCGLVAAFPRPGAAGAPATLNTAIAASAVEPQQPTIAIAADRAKKPTSTASLQFRLQSLPTDVTLTVCAMRFVMADDIPKGDDSGVLLELIDPAAKPERTVAAITVPPATPKSTAIVLRSRALCEALQPRVKRAGDQADLARFRLQTTIRDGKVVIFGAAADRPVSVVPRLMLTYDRPNALPGDAEWSQIRRDAQHSGRSAWKMYDPDGTYAPTAFAAVPLNIPGAEAKVRGDLRQSPLLYGGRIFAVLDAGPSQYRTGRARPLRPGAERGDAGREAGVPRRRRGRPPVRRHRRTRSSISTFRRCPPRPPRSPSRRERRCWTFRRSAPTVPSTS